MRYYILWITVWGIFLYNWQGSQLFTLTQLQHVVNCAATCDVYHVTKLQWISYFIVTLWDHHPVCSPWTEMPLCGA